MGGDVSAPVSIQKVELTYTKRARKEKITGTVILAGVVTANGTPRNLQVVKGLTMDGLNAEAVKAVSGWRFKLAEKAGAPVSVRAEFAVNFRLCCRWKHVSLAERISARAYDPLGQSECPIGRA